jgi:two-component system, OmpR family, alkaline phosphatase synthesis response regulator PhoP
MKERILIVEDEPDLRQSLVDCLNVRQYDVQSTRDGQTALNTATESRFDLIILDIMLPSMNGLDVCRKLREREVQTPVLMLTARGTLKDKVVGLREGADDYMTKPFEMEELLARIGAILRRAALTTRDVYEIHGIQMDFKNSRIVRRGQMTDLSEREARLLRYFVEHQGEILSRQELLRAVWGYNFVPFSRTVDVHVAWLRQKLEDDPGQPRLIVTVHGQGYRFAG